jgi:hypothetical protein
MIFPLLAAVMLSLSLNGPALATGDSRSEPTGLAANYATRDGEAEAVAELSTGAPHRLYTHIWNGRAPGFRTPGLKFCDPRYAATLEEQQLFRPLPEADWGEPEPFPPQYEAAVRFARAYNLTMFARRKAQIVRICRLVARDQ